MHFSTGRTYGAWTHIFNRLLQTELLLRSTALAVIYILKQLSTTNANAYLYIWHMLCIRENEIRYAARISAPAELSVCSTLVIKYL